MCLHLCVSLCLCVQTLFHRDFSSSLRATVQVSCGCKFTKCRRARVLAATKTAPVLAMGLWRHNSSKKIESSILLAAEYSSSFRRIQSAKGVPGVCVSGLLYTCILATLTENVRTFSKRSVHGGRLALGGWVSCGILGGHLRAFRAFSKVSCTLVSWRPTLSAARTVA